MKRTMLIVLGGYLLVAMGNKVAEAAGAMTCECADGCWCRRPGLSFFRWVFPWLHRGAHSADQKANFDSSDV